MPILRISKWWTRFFSLGTASAVVVFPFVFFREKRCRDDAVLRNHELIHLRQVQELGVVFFYLWYFIEFLVRLARWKTRWQAYRNISFERECYAMQHRPGYLSVRSCWQFLKYV